MVGGDADLEDTLRNASLLLGAEAEGKTEAQDLFAAATAEYGRLVGALYAEGHYSPVVTILIDGREAASIPPLDAPGQIGQIKVVVNPGPAFKFSTAKVAPLAPGTELPKDFATGNIARSGLIKDSVQAGVDGWRAVGHAKAKPAGQNIVADHAQSQAWR